MVVIGRTLRDGSGADALRDVDRDSGKLLHPEPPLPADQTLYAAPTQTALPCGDGQAGSHGLPRLIPNALQLTIP